MHCCRETSPLDNLGTHACESGATTGWISGLISYQDLEEFQPRVCVRGQVVKSVGLQQVPSVDSSKYALTKHYYGKFRPWTKVNHHRIGPSTLAERSCFIIDFIADLQDRGAQPGSKVGSYLDCQLNILLDNQGQLTMTLPGQGLSTRNSFTVTPQSTTCFSKVTLRPQFHRKTSEPRILSLKCQF